MLTISVGNRSCIGKKFAKIESVLVLAQILRNYKVHLADPTYKMDVEVVVTIRPVKPLFIRFEKRN
jgi:cytochrome P450/NADPH-cytochrome P450 reductase